MAKILIGDEWFDEMASTSIYESEFEKLLFQEAGQIFSDYFPVPFKTVVFSQDGDAKPDFALVHKDYRSFADCHVLTTTSRKLSISARIILH
jgi:hypothetical protein